MSSAIKECSPIHLCSYIFVLFRKCYLGCHQVNLTLTVIYTAVFVITVYLHLFLKINTDKICDLNF